MRKHQASALAPVEIQYVFRRGDSVRILVQRVSTYTGADSQYTYRCRESVRILVHYAQTLSTCIGAL